MYKSARVLLRGHGYHKGVTSIIADPITQPIRKAVAGVNVYDQKNGTSSPIYGSCGKNVNFGKEI